MLVTVGPLTAKSGPEGILFMPVIVVNMSVQVKNKTKFTKLNNGCEMLLHEFAKGIIC